MNKPTPDNKDKNFPSKIFLNSSGVNFGLIQTDCEAVSVKIFPIPHFFLSFVTNNFKANNLFNKLKSVKQAISLLFISYSFFLMIIQNM